MTMTKTMRLAAILAATAMVLAAPARATTTGVTTSTYTDASTSDDIALSCKDLTVGSSDGVVVGSCNRADGIVSTSSLDLDNHVKCVPGGSAGTAVIAWATAGMENHSIATWSLSVDSTGDDYTVTGGCVRLGGLVYDPSSLDLGDLTDGLKNDMGKLKAR